MSTSTPSRIRPGGVLVALVLALLGAAGWLGERTLLDDSTSAQTPQAEAGDVRESERAGRENGAARRATLFRDRVSDAILEVEGEVRRLLRDDEEGTPHQKWVLELADGATLLVVHNLELSERVPLREGDRIRARGEYEWNERGGLLHWTHHDPAGRHEDGWVEFAGKRYGAR